MFCELSAPNVFILGGAKCGTSSIAFWLKQNPDVCLAKDKEPLFLNTNEYRHGMKWYWENYFGEYSGQKYAVDAASMNLVTQFVAPRIAQICKKPKLIICVREPVMRAYSHWGMQRYKYSPGYTFDTFEEALADNHENFSYKKFSTEYERMRSFDGRFESYIPTFIEQGLYAHHIKRFLNFFKSEDIFIVNQEAMKASPEQAYNNVCSFLDIQPTKVSFKSKNLSSWCVGNKKKTLNDLIECNIVRKTFENYFLPDSIELSKLTGFNFYECWGYDEITRFV